MISDVANQKTDRREKGYDHAHHVTAPGAATDEVQPVEIKMVLTRLNVALRAGRSEVEITLKRLNR